MNDSLFHSFEEPLLRVGESMDQTSLETKVVTTATDFDTLQRGSYSDKENFCYISFLSDQGGRTR